MVSSFMSAFAAVAQATAAPVAADNYVFVDTVSWLNGGSPTLFESSVAWIANRSDGRVWQCRANFKAGSKELTMPPMVVCKRAQFQPGNLPLDEGPFTYGSHNTGPVSSRVGDYFVDDQFMWILNQKGRVSVCNRSMKGNAMVWCHPDKGLTLP